MSIMDSITEFKATRQIQKALKKDPNNVEALLQLATWLDALKEPDLVQKRKVLHRILSLEPAHRKARTMLFEMDRAEIGGDASLSAAVILTDRPKSEIAEKSLLLRYSPLRQFLVYLLIFVTVLITVRVRELDVLAVFGAFLLFLVIPLWFVSVVVEIGETELRVSRLFGAVRWEIPWQDMKTLQRNALRQGIRIITHNEKVVEISSRVIGYSAVIEILRQMRPDLFDRSKASDATRSALTE